MAKKRKKDIIRQNLLLLVESTPDVKKSRNLLITEYWKQFDGAESLDDSPNCIAAESIVREFRRMIEDGVVKVDKQSKKVLKEKEAEYRATYSKYSTVRLTVFSEPIKIDIAL